MRQNPSQDGQEDLEPVRGPRRTGNNLPLQLTSFVGREREMAEVETLLSEHRLLTLTGPGGSGKTRLALAVASGTVEGFKDGVWLVELAPLTDPALVFQAVASVLGVQETPGSSLVDTLVGYLEPRRILLVLDNCEHLVDACASLAEALLRRRSPTSGYWPRAGRASGWRARRSSLSRPSPCLTRTVCLPSTA